MINPSDRNDKEYDELIEQVDRQIEQIDHEQAGHEAEASKFQFVLANVSELRTE